MTEAESWVSTALNKLQGNEGAVQAWFGRADAQTLQEVRKGLVGMVKTLSMSKIKVGGPPVPPERSSTCWFVDDQGVMQQTSTMAYVMSYSNRQTGEWLYGEKE